MPIAGTNVLITGCNRGLGRALVPAFLDAGVKRIYATVRDTRAVVFEDARIDVVPLDVTRDESVSAVAARCHDADVIVNNAAYLGHSQLINAVSLDAARLEMETNYWGVLRICRAFAPLLAARGGGMIANVLSIGSLASVPFCGSYTATKAAAWSLTQAIRAELKTQGTTVAAIFPGGIATDMARPHELDGRCPPDEMAMSIVAALGRRETMIFPDARSKDVAAEYALKPWDLEAKFSSKLT